MVSTALANKYLQKLENLINTNEYLEQAWLDILDSQALVDLLYSQTLNDIKIDWGATRATFIFDKDYVLKVDLDNTNSDNILYNEQELYNWEGLEGTLIEKAFCPIELLGKVRDRKVYIMPYVMVSPTTIEDKTLNSYKIINNIPPDEDEDELIDTFSVEVGWDTDFIYYLFYEVYGEVFATKLINTLDRYGINDIHSGNVGIDTKTGNPIIFDYAGY